MATTTGSLTVEVTLKVRNQKNLAALMLIRDQADSIAEDQPWNDDAKAIAALARKILSRIQTKTKSP